LVKGSSWRRKRGDVDVRIEGRERRKEVIKGKK
jgi:hypothetical protein